MSETILYRTSTLAAFRVSLFAGGGMITEPRSSWTCSRAVQLEVPALKYDCVVAGPHAELALSRYAVRSAGGPLVTLVVAHERINWRPDATVCEAPVPVASSHFTGAMPPFAWSQKPFTVVNPVSSMHGAAPVTTPVGTVPVSHAGRKLVATTTPVLAPGVNCAQFPPAASWSEDCS